MTLGPLDPGWVFLALIVSVAACVIINRVLRTINIAIRGWPPPHVDADGDAVESSCDCGDEDEPEGVRA